MEEVGLYTIWHYVQVRRQTIAKYIVDRPILTFFMGKERRRGTSPHQFWWEKPVDWDLVKGVTTASVVAGED